MHAELTAFGPQSALQLPKIAPPAQPWPGLRSPVPHGQEHRERVCSCVQLSPAISMPSRSFVIVTSCSDGKRGLAQAAALRLRDFRKGSIDERFQSWWSALRQLPAPQVSARDLYCGDHIAVSLQLPQRLARVLPHCAATLLIASAGYGLLATDTQVRHYSATFSSGQADSISKSSGLPLQEERTAWWRLLCEQALSPSTKHRSLTALALQQPSRTILVVASPAYVSAMAEDLLFAKTLLRSPGELLIISSPCENLPPTLQHSLLPSNARLQALVSGPRQSLHARVAGLLIDHAEYHNFQPDRARALLTRLTAEAPALPTYDRKPQTDRQIQVFIQRQLQHTSKPSATGLLRKLRDAGFQCEQHRFKRLFEQVTSEAS